MPLQTRVFGNEDISEIVLQDTANPYVLQVMRIPLADEALGVTIEDRRTHTLSTGRTTEEYKRYIPLLAFAEEHAATGKRFAEIGPGVSEFMTYYSSLRKPGEPLPLVIDPLDYDSAMHLLEAALRLAEFGDSPFREQMERICRMHSACDDVRDATRVELLNCTLGQAVQRYPHILGKHDVVIDLFGASEYPQVEDASLPPQDPVLWERQVETVIALQRFLLKPDGLLLNTKTIS